MKLHKRYAAAEVQDVTGNMPPRWGGRRAQGLPKVTGTPVLWYDASDAAMYDYYTSTNVATLWDKVGNGTDMFPAQSATANVPITESAINSRPAFNFDGSTHMYANYTVNNGSGSNYTTFFVGQVPDLLGEYSLFGGDVSGASGNGALQTRIKTTTGYLESLKASVSSIYTNTTYAISANTPFVAVVRWTAASEIAHWINGNKESSATATTLNNSRTLIVGADHASGWLNLYKGYMGEFIRYHSALSDGDVDTISDWLAAKWGGIY